MRYDGNSDAFCGNAEAYSNHDSQAFCNHVTEAFYTGDPAFREYGQYFSI